MRKESYIYIRKNERNDEMNIMRPVVSTEVAVVAVVSLNNREEFLPEKTGEDRIALLLDDFFFKMQRPLSLSLKASTSSMSYSI